MKNKTSESMIKKLNKIAAKNHLTLSQVGMEHAEMETVVYNTKLEKQNLYERSQMAFEDLYRQNHNQINISDIKDILVMDQDAQLRKLKEQMDLLAIKYEKGWKDIEHREEKLRAEQASLIRRNEDDSAITL